MATLLSVNNYYYYRGGAETVFLEHNRLFEEHGWRVVPFSMQHPKNLATPWADRFIEEIEFGSAYSAGEKLRRGLKAIYSPEARRKIGALIDEVQPDVCHAHNIYHHLSPSILGSLRERGIPTVMTLHDLKLACPAYSMLAPDGICERCKGGRIYNVVVHRCMKRSVALSGVVFAEAALHRLLGSYEKSVGRFIVPSRFYLEKFCEWGKPREMFRHVPNFVSIERFAPRFDPGAHCTYVGRLSKEKGLTTLVRAAALSGCRVDLVGTGPQLPELQSLVAELSAPVHFLGYLTGAPLQDAIAGARALVLPSEWYENAPLSILEAYAMGKPVLGARIGGIPEMIKEGETGLGFTSANPEALAAALQSVSARDDESIRQWGRNARHWVETEFSADAYRRRVGAVYEELGVAVPPSGRSRDDRSR